MVGRQPPQCAGDATQETARGQDAFRTVPVNQSTPHQAGQHTGQRADTPNPAYLDEIEIQLLANVEWRSHDRIAAASGRLPLPLIIRLSRQRLEASRGVGGDTRANVPSGVAVLPLLRLRHREASRLDRFLSGCDLAR